jgi:GNAT superfamily N-acetyltransferase
VATILQATETPHLDGVRMLMDRYIGWHRTRHAAHRALIDRYFEPTAFAAELAALPGAFAPPRGRLLLAMTAEGPAGTVALSDLGGGTCEMKRLFVVPDAQGTGLGRALVSRLIVEAEAIGYRQMRLDTGPLQGEAHALYRALGFRPIAPYGDHDPEMRDWLLYFQRELAGAGAEARPLAQATSG